MSKRDEIGKQLVALAGRETACLKRAREARSTLLAASSFETAKDLAELELNAVVDAVTVLTSSHVQMRELAKRRRALQAQLGGDED